MENDYLNMLASIVLPTQILDYFSIVGISQTSTEIHISLDERMNPELSGDVHFESKGFMGAVEYNGERFHASLPVAVADLTFCYFPWKLTLCHLKASEIHLYGAGGGGGRKKRSLAERAETQMSANRGAGFLFVAGAAVSAQGLPGHVSRAGLVPTY